MRSSAAILSVALWVVPLAQVSGSQHPTTVVRAIKSWQSDGPAKTTSDRAEDDGLPLRLEQLDQLLLGADVVPDLSVRVIEKADESNPAHHFFLDPVNGIGRDSPVFREVTMAFESRRRAPSVCPRFLPGPVLRDVRRYRDHWTRPAERRDAWGTGIAALTER